MTQVILVVEDIKDWSAYYPARHLMSAQDYLDAQTPFAPGRVQVINLCRSYRYLSPGYYCSLLASARGHQVLPSVKTVNDLSRKALYRLHFETMEASLEKAMKKHAAGHDRISLKVYFGMCQVPGLQEIARQVFDQLPAPILQVELRKREEWEIETVKSVGIHQLKGEEEDHFAAALEAFNARVWRKAGTRRKFRYDLAVLVNPNEKLPPSDPQALKRFVRAGAELGINVELIRREDYPRLAEYDGLFIRETTALDHHTYQFAR